MWNAPPAAARWPCRPADPARPAAPARFSGGETKVGNLDI